MRITYSCGRIVRAALTSIVLLVLSISFVQAQARTVAALPPLLPPTHVIDLMTAEGIAAFGGQWKTMEARIVEGPALPKALPSYKTSYEVQPRAGERAFDDSAWPVIEAKDLAVPRGGGRISFIWFRTNLTIPARLGTFDTSGATAVLRVWVDDYAEVWINGELPRFAGRLSPGTIQGYNAVNRVLLSDGIKTGDTFQIAVFAINGPISAAPPNFLYVREAKIEFYK